MKISSGHLSPTIILFEGPLASPACPSDKSSIVIKMKMSVEQWWNDAEKGKPKYWERNLSWYQFVHHQFISLICDKSVITQDLAFLSYCYRKKRLQIHF